ncbi:MAG: ABC transporter ATP-binding protein [Eubacterium sp.]|nr:ABC transporter ATP-binding protein [Eubacterium sp.]
MKKFRGILSRHQKVRIIELGFLMIIGGFLEMLSVSLILPFMDAVMTPERIMKNSIVVAVCDFFDLHSHRTFLVLLALVLAIIYILKNAFLLFQMHVQARFVANNQFAVQCRLLHNYINRPYEYFLWIDSGEVLRVITNDTAQTFTLLSNIMMFFSEMVVSGILIITIFVASPGVTIAMAALLLVMVLVIMGVLRPILNRSSKRNAKAAASMNKWLLQSIQGIKELKIMRKEEFFEEEFNESGSEYVRMSRRVTTLGQIPRFMIEAVAMSLFLLVVAYLIYKGTDLEDVIPLLSVVAMAAIRLLPSVNRISLCMAAMASGEPYLDKMIENLQEVHSYTDDEAVEEQPGAVGRLDREFGFEDVAYRYPSGDSDVLTGADINIKTGESVGIVGASGAGKTTAVDILLGLLRPKGGQVVVDGTDIRLDMDGWLSQIGYIPQMIFMLDGTIRENVAFGVPEDEVDDDRVREALREAALLDFVDSLSGGLDTELGERGVRLSGGQRQRIGIARALYTDPSILFFDEATSALDNETETAIMESINSLHGTKTMVIIAHRLTTIEGCDHIFRVADGKVIMER